MAVAKTRAGKKRAETLRLKRLSSIESAIHSTGFEKIAGVDEAGRGPLAGPVVAAACILPKGYVLRGINDSKKLTKELRYQLYRELILDQKISVGIGIVEPFEIDKLNIHFASLEAMVRAVLRLPLQPDFVLVDGKHLPESGIPSEALVDGDRKSQAIAAASILAKVTRDHIMMGYDVLYPEYGFGKHMGYGTQIHQEALKTYGPSPIHRMTFKGVKRD